nr:hypothetical protein [Aneurinibacillus terranovensis]
MLQLMTRVKIISDLLNLGLPVGKEAYIIGHNRRIDIAYQYLIRVPALKKEFWVVANDIKPLSDSDTSLDYSSEVNKLLIDVALKTKQFDIIKNLKGTKED